MSDDRYRLIDFGDGRKLESLAGHLIDRPSPAAEGETRRFPKKWADADARFDAASRSWLHRRPWPESLSIDCGTFRIPVRPTPFGHIGVFPEQAPNWRWLAEPIKFVGSPTDAPSGLNLFGYTGASTLAMSFAGLQVVHVDAAKPNVQAAKMAVADNQWQDRPIRYLVDDAAKFVAREIRRGRRYHTIALDPPAYGHAGSSKTWRLQRDLWPLLDQCVELLDPNRFRLLVTGHSPQVGVREVVSYLRDHRRFCQLADPSALRTQSGRSQLKADGGRSLDAGFYVRIENQVVPDRSSTI